MDNLRHPHFKFDPKDLSSETIVHLLRRFERQFKETAMHTHNVWNEGDGNQRLEFFVRDYLEVFREMKFRPICNAEDRRLIGPPRSPTAPQPCH